MQFYSPATGWNIEISPRQRISLINMPIANVRNSLLSWILNEPFPHSRKLFGKQTYFRHTIESHITVPRLHLLSSTNNGRQGPFSIAHSIAECGPRWLKQVFPWDIQQQMGNRDKEFLSSNTFVTIKGAQTIYSTRLDQHAWSYITWRGGGGRVAAFT